MVTLLSNSAGGVVGSLLSSAIHFLEGGPYLQNYTSPQVCFIIYASMQLLMFLSGACLLPEAQESSAQPEQQSRPGQNAGVPSPQSSLIQGPALNLEQLGDESAVGMET